MLQVALDTGLETAAALISGAMGEQLTKGVDDVERGAINLDDLAQRAGLDLTSRLGEFVSHSAADEMGRAASTVVIGPPAPLASDLLDLPKGYRFLEEAVRVARGAGRPGVAVLLTDWLLERETPARELLAVHPHLALLYLVAADVGAQAELLSRRELGWYLDGTPIITALDERLRHLGYEVWDERYRGQDELIASLGKRLVEQGMRVGALQPGPHTSSPLEAPSSYGYYEASELLTAEPAGRIAR